MKLTRWMVAIMVLAVAGCDGTGTSTNVSVSGSGAVGISTGISGAKGYYGGAGLPPGRTPSERAARREYYRGPRGDV